MSKIPEIVIGGDVHGHIQSYVNRVSPFEYSIQVGDMGFNYSGLNVLNPKKHVFIGGNHDNYYDYYNQPHALGDYGTYTIGGATFFYIRGAHSIDAAYRIQYEMDTGIKTHWSEEILPKTAFDLAIQQYAVTKPEIMITHTAPNKTARMMGDLRSIQTLQRYGHDASTYREPTQDALQVCLDIHQPKLWFFGHFHRSLDFQMYQYNTRFVCVNELELANLSVYMRNYL